MYVINQLLNKKNKELKCYALRSLQTMPFWGEISKKIFRISKIKIQNGYHFKRNVSFIRIPAVFEGNYIKLQTWTDNNKLKLPPRDYQRKDILLTDNCLFSIITMRYFLNRFCIFFLLVLVIIWLLTLQNKKLTCMSSYRCILPKLRKKKQSIM